MGAIRKDPVKFFDLLDQIIRTFPATRDWRSWWMQDGVRQMTFEVFKSNPQVTERLEMYRTTNVAESINRQIKRTSVGISGVLQYVSHIHSYCLLIEDQLEAVRTGIGARYGRKRKSNPTRNPSKYENDGMPPLENLSPVKKKIKNSVTAR